MCEDNVCTESVFSVPFPQSCFSSYVLFVSLFICNALVSANSSVSKPNTVNIHKHSFGS